MNKTLAYGLLVSLGMSTAYAANIGEGTLTLAESELTFNGGPGIGANLSSTAGDLTCMDPLLPCDDYALTADLPAGLGEFFPNSQIQIDLFWESPTEQDDYDLHLYNENGDLIAESTNAGGPERVGTIALEGVKAYGITISHWLAVGAAYEGAIRLDLGEPDPSKTEQEVALWLAENGVANSDDVEARAEDNPYCSEPGPIVVTDPAGDNGLIVVPLPGTDLLSLSVFQTQDDNGEDLIGFQLVTDEIGQLYPQSVYFASFDTLFGVPMGVRMVVDQESNVSFVSYTVGPDSDDEFQGHFIADGSAKPAHEMSNYSADGMITIYAKPADIGLLLAGDPLIGFNAGVILNIGAEGAATLALNSDAMPDSLEREGQFTYQTEEECLGGADEVDAEERGTLLDTRGGAAGPCLLILFATTLLWRRRLG